MGPHFAKSCVACGLKRIALVREAGGTCLSLDGHADPLQSRDILCANEAAERLLRETLAKA